MEMIFLGICFVFMSLAYVAVGTIINLMGGSLHQFKPLIYSIGFLIIAIVRHNIH